MTFRWFMEQALYHPALGFYSSGRCRIGRRGDYFTNVSVGSLFGRLMARQFGEIWERLGRPDDFVSSNRARTMERLRVMFSRLRATRCRNFSQRCVIESSNHFLFCETRQKATLESCRPKIEWVESIEQLEPFIGVHFSNELIDAMPVHLVSASNKEWREKYVTLRGDALDFTDGPISSDAIAGASREISCDRLITTKPKSISSRSTGLNNCRRRSSAALFSRSTMALRGKISTRRHARAGHCALLRNIDSLPRHSSTQATSISLRMSTGRACARKPNDVA